MNRLQAILLSLVLAAFAQYAYAGVSLQHGGTDDGKAIVLACPAVTTANSVITEDYESQGPEGTGDVPETVAPKDEMKGDNPPAGSPSGHEGDKSMEPQQPTDTGNPPESVEPKGESEGSGTPLAPTPGSSY